MKKYDDYNMAKMLNYPSKGYIFFATIMYFIIVLSTLIISELFYNNTLISIIFGVSMVIAVLLTFLFLNYTFVYKSIQFYEKTYGATGLGNKYLKKWEGEK